MGRWQNPRVGRSVEGETSQHSLAPLRLRLGVWYQKSLRIENGDCTVNGELGRQ